MRMVVSVNVKTYNPYSNWTLTAPADRDHMLVQ